MPNWLFEALWLSLTVFVLIWSVRVWAGRSRKWMAAPPYRGAWASPGASALVAASGLIGGLITLLPQRADIRWIAYVLLAIAAAPGVVGVYAYFFDPRWSYPINLQHRWRPLLGYSGRSSQKRPAGRRMRRARGRPPRLP